MKAEYFGVEKDVAANCALLREELRWLTMIRCMRAGYLGLGEGRGSYLCFVSKGDAHKWLMYIVVAFCAGMSECFCWPASVNNRFALKDCNKNVAALKDCQKIGASMGCSSMRDMAAGLLLRLSSNDY